MDNLTKEESAAIKSLERLAKRWPKTLLLFAGGSLQVRKPSLFGNKCGNESTVATVSGIWCDGGDGGDNF